MGAFVFRRLALSTVILMIALSQLVGCASDPLPESLSNVDDLVAIDDAVREKSRTMAPDSRMTLMDRPNELSEALVVRAAGSMREAVKSRRLEYAGASGTAFTFRVEHPIHRDLLQKLSREGITVEATLLPEEGRQPARFAIAKRPVFQAITAGNEDKVEQTRGAEQRRARRGSGRRSNGTSAPTTAPTTTTDSHDTTETPATTQSADPMGPMRSLIRLRGNELVTGEPVWALDGDDASTLVHAASGYLGHVQTDALEFVDGPRFVDAMNPARSPESAAKIEQMIAVAKTRLGQPYVWAGRCADGVDCSGLVQTCYAAIGVNLPRDADQQSVVGKLVATRWFTDALLPGDILFFLSERDGKVGHTAIYIGDDQYIESAFDGVNIHSMRRTDGTFDEKRMKGFCWARRVLD